MHAHMQLADTFPLCSSCPSPIVCLSPLWCCSLAAEAQEFKKKFEEAAEENSKLINMAAVPAAENDGQADEADKLAEGLSKTVLKGEGDDTAAAQKTDNPVADDLATSKAE